MYTAQSLQYIKREYVSYYFFFKFGFDFAIIFELSNTNSGEIVHLRKYGRKYIFWERKSHVT